MQPALFILSVIIITVKIGEALVNESTEENILGTT